jgi:hypothetical protein
MTYATALLHHLQRSLHRDVCISFADLAVDDQGDICVPGVLAPVYVSLLSDGGSSGTWARVWTIAAEGLKPHVRLLREINEINSDLFGARVLLDGGRLIVTAEVRAESIEPGELGELVQTVSRCAARVGPLVGIVHGAATLSTAGGGRTS